MQIKPRPKYDTTAIYVLNLEHSIFEFVSDFGFRYSVLKLLLAFGRTAFCDQQKMWRIVSPSKGRKVKG